ncbi:pepsinogen c [Grosmannia clavigera kw1407]|uniref:Pepsinogen c n=1 Tax=Grosmannia clavigera (strain kw1407 / UAMH 11150) TaxID=655863 RepID=F0XF36_GROCL|nr:pepsinogen c [Grosmannia clavigera kw1407]EFX04034.1 pepsinogen c [Grosmannia clavigera kw1407]
MKSVLPLACLPGTLAAVFELPVWIRNTYAVVEIEAGTPPVSHYLEFDTGSSSTWMASSDCVADPSACPNSSGYKRPGYDASASSTSSSLNTTASIGYLGGTTGGSGAKDMFAMPSAPKDTWAQTFLAVNESSFAALPGDGFLGLAFSTIAEGETTTLVETMMQDGLLDEPRFALYRGSETNDTGSSPGNGMLTVGGSHEDKYVNGSLAWTQLQYPGSEAQLWRTAMQSVVSRRPNTANTTFLDVNDCWAVFDTGAGGITVPDRLIDQIYESIGMNYTAILNGDVIPLCEDFTDDWGITVYIGDFVPATELTITGSMLKNPGFADGEAKYCWPPFDSNEADGLFLFGNSFLQHFYTVFDFGGNLPTNYSARIGLGPLKDEYKPVL